MLIILLFATLHLLSLTEADKWKDPLLAATYANPTTENNNKLTKLFT